MRQLDDITRRLRGRLPQLHGPASGNGNGSGALPAAGPPAAEHGVAPAELTARRDRLARELAELQWDLGGLTYEMAIRDHFRLDVLVRQSARLQELDAELGEVERLLRLDDAGAAGACPSCGSLHARGASFCWQCGYTLLPTGVVAGSTPPPAANAPA